MAYVPCTPAEIAAGEATKQELFQKICDNGDDHETRITDIENDTATSLIVGEIRMFGGASAPAGWFFCDGSVKDKTTEADLFAVIGSTFDTGGEAGTEFRLPDFRAKSPAGVNDGTLPAGANGSFTTRNRGDIYGAETVDINHTHGLNSHTHLIDDHNHQWYQNNAAGSSDHSWRSNGTTTNLITKGTAKTGAAEGICVVGSADSFVGPIVALPLRGAASTDLWTEDTTISALAAVGSTTTINSGVSVPGILDPALSVNFIIKT